MKLGARPPAESKPTPEAVRLAAALLVSLLLLAAPARGVILDGPDGSANTAAPPDDPGFAHVGRKDRLTAVYVGGSWVLTADHVAIGPVTLNGVRYDFVQDSKRTLQPIDAATGTPDLALFRIHPEPPLAALPIREDPPLVGLPVTMIGNGASRGPATTWVPPSGPPIDGWEWANPHAIRWGRNFVEAVDFDVISGGRRTRAISTDFTQGFGPDECQAANGDSGGGLFVQDPPGTGAWELAGILVAVGTFMIEGVPQPASTALHGNRTYAADLSAYRDQILAIRDAPRIPSLPGWGLPVLGAGLAAAAFRSLAGRRGGSDP